MLHPLIDKFKGRATVRGGICAFAPEDAIDVIEAAKDAGCPVIGIDGLFLKPDATEPSLENSIDYSAAVRQGTDTNEAALKFVKERSDRGLHFEIVLIRDRAGAGGAP
jgi:ABC-type sugar transport system substrate-binding protein